jgi:hypothetical protein
MRALGPSSIRQQLSELGAGSSSGWAHSLKGLLPVVLAILAGCSPKDSSCTELDKGDTLEVEVLEPWTSESAYALPARERWPAELFLPPCAASDVENTTYTLRLSRVLERAQDDGCYLPVCPDDFPTTSTSVNDTGYDAAAHHLCVNSDRKTRIKSCEARRVVSLQQIEADANPFADPVPGEIPPVVLIRRFLFGVADGSTTCDEPGDIFSEESRMTNDVDGEYYECADAWVVRVSKE